MNFTVFFGLSHLGYPGGHHLEVALLTGVPPEAVWMPATVATPDLARSGSGPAQARSLISLPVLRAEAKPVAGIAGVKVPSEEQAIQIARSSSSSTAPPGSGRAIGTVSRPGPETTSSTAYASRRRTLAGDLGPADRLRWTYDVDVDSREKPEQRLPLISLMMRRSPGSRPSRPYRRLPGRPAHDEARRQWLI